MSGTKRKINICTVCYVREALQSSKGGKFCAPCDSLRQRPPGLCIAHDITEKRSSVFNGVRIYYCEECNIAVRRARNGEMVCVCVHQSRAGATYMEYDASGKWRICLVCRARTWRPKDHHCVYGCKCTDSDIAENAKHSDEDD